MSPYAPHSMLLQLLQEARAFIRGVQTGTDEVIDARDWLKAADRALGPAAAPKVDRSPTRAIETVWIVSLEWNQPPSEVTGDTGIVGVFATRQLAEACQLQQRQEFDAQGSLVYQYSTDIYGNLYDDSQWEIDVHCTAHQVYTQPAGKPRKSTKEGARA